MRTSRSWLTAFTLLAAASTLCFAEGKAAMAQTLAPMVDSGTNIDPFIDDVGAGESGGQVAGGGQNAGGGQSGEYGGRNFGDQSSENGGWGGYEGGSADYGQWTESYDQYPGAGESGGGGVFSGLLCRLMHPDPCRCRCLEFFGEYLALRPRNAEVAYAVPVDGPIAPVLGNGIQIGDFGVVSPGESSGFRAGFSYVLNDCSRLVVSYSDFNSSDSNKISVGPPDAVRSLVTHPLTNNAAADGLQAQASYDINFDMVDLAYHGCLCCSQRNYFEYILGVRYGELGQQFHSDISFNGVTDVDTAIQFNGIGPRLGLYGERRMGCVGLHLYGRTEASFLAGEFNANYQQSDSFAQTIVDTGMESSRIVSLLETELGFGWTSGCGRFRVTTGYLISSWFNTVKTDEFINAVQANSPDQLGDLLTFDGLVVRASMRF